MSARRGRPPRADAAVMRALWDADVPTAEIARQLGVTPHAVLIYGWRHGWPRRPRGGYRERRPAVTA